jgi:phosphoribosylglycinamide formyltransferase-1
VDQEYDTGPIVAQCRIPVRPQDTVETLSERVLQREHSFLVETLGKVAEGAIRLSGLP